MAGVGWVGELDGRERRTLMACFGGWALDAFDVNLYALVIPTLLTVLGMTRGQAGLLGTVALLFSAFGGWLTGALADRYGRVAALQITVLWFAVFTFLSGFCTNFDEFMVVRALQGLGFGGEWAAGAVLMSEVIRPEFRGRAVGSVQSGFAIGWGAAIGAFAVVFALLPPDIAWRVLFWLGLLPAALVIYIRRFVVEPEGFKASLAARRRPGLRQMFVIFSPRHLRITILTVLLSTGAQGGYYAVGTWLPTFLRTDRGLSALSSSGYLAFVILGAFCGFLTGAWLADRIGRKATFVLMGVCAAAVVVLYMLIPIGNGAMLVLGFPLGFFANGLFAPMGAYLAELFPTEIRATNQGFSYNAGRAIGALFPAAIGYLGERMGLGNAIAVFTLASYVCLLGSLTMLPETRGRALPGEPSPSVAS